MTVPARQRQERISCPLGKTCATSGRSQFGFTTYPSIKNRSVRGRKKTDRHHTLCNAWCCAFCLVFCTSSLGTRYLVSTAAGQRQRKEKTIKQRTMQEQVAKPTTLCERVMWKCTCRPSSRVRSLGVTFFGSARPDVLGTVGADCGNASCRGGTHQDDPALEKLILAWRSKK